MQTLKAHRSASSRLHAPRQRSGLVRVLIIALGASLPAAAQTTYYVAPCGDDTWAGISGSCAAPGGPKRTIQAAIDTAMHGDTILVADGVYTGPGNRDMNFGGKAITLRSASGAAACIIDVQGSQIDPHRAFHFHSGETTDSVLEGFTIRGGFMDTGGAVFCEAGASPSIDLCVFEENTAHPGVAPGAGGAIAGSASSPRLSGCLFLRNRAVRLEGSQGIGGAARFVGGSPVLIDCTFEENTAGLVGGAVVVAQANPTLVGCTFLRNSTTAYPVGGGGGYFANLGGHSTLLNCRFIENQTTNILGGAWIANGASATITGCSFIGNHGYDAGGLGIGNGGAQGVITNCLFADNTADIFSAALEVWNAVGAPASATMANCTFANNLTSAGYGAVVVGNTSSLVAANCIVRGNAPSEIVTLDAGSATFTFSNIQGGWPGAANIDADPLFSGSGEHPYALLSGSPSIDTGTNASVPPGVTTDLAGNSRFLDDPCAGAAAGAIVDMGAYEYRRYTDCDLDGQLTLTDVVCFLNKLAAGDPDADCNGDGRLCGADFGCFQSQFAQRCR